jgi:preprotein translocase subunit SecB
MKVSPLQPKGIVFEEVSVQPTTDKDGNLISTEDFDFQGVKLGCDVGHGDVLSENGEPVDNTMIVSVKLHIPNEEGKLAPYRVKVSATGIFKWLDTSTSQTARRDLTVVNGASLLYGAVREMVLTITSRSMSGPMLLPSVHFQDSKPSEMEAQAKEKPVLDDSQAPAIKRRSRSPSIPHSAKGE